MFVVVNTFPAEVSVNRIVWDHAIEVTDILNEIYVISMTDTDILPRAPETHVHSNRLLLVQDSARRAHLHFDANDIHEYLLLDG